MTFRKPIAGQSDLVSDILDLSRQNNLHPLSPWFFERLRVGVERGDFLPVHSLEYIVGTLTHRLAQYRMVTGRDTVVGGMSGGVDSAVTAALFKRAGYRVIGVTMPIHQNPEETDRGVEACNSLGIDHLHVDLSDLYDATLRSVGDYDLDPVMGDTHDVRIRRGNVRARLRMITVYNLASKNNGFVFSTDNFSELVAGFWTLHGDVGDVAPIQSLLKSWEVPAIARLLGLPEATWRATPTDGLGISPGDESQLGCSYLEWDIMTLAIAEAIRDPRFEPHTDAALTIANIIGLSDRKDWDIFNSVAQRVGGSWFKRASPINFDHPVHPRLTVISDIDDRLFVPEFLRASH